MKLAALAGIALSAALTGCAATAPVPPAPRPVTIPAIPDSLNGVYEPGAPASYAGITRFAAATGAAPELALYYSAWFERFAAGFAAQAHAHGAVPFVQIQSGREPLAGITAGRFDAFLRAYALSVKAYGHPVVLSFDHEMNGGWYPWGAGHTAPAVYIAAWRHVVGVFRAVGASNVTWMWTVNSTNVATDSLRQWWPGSAYVGWVGIDGYYYYSTDTFASVFGATVAQVRKFTTAPVLIAETAVGTTADRDAQITGLFAGVKADKLLGLVWFDEKQDKGVYHQDWRLENDPPALAAYRAAVKAAR